MFTGIIQEVGSLDGLEPRSAGTRLRVRAPKICPELRDGDSVSVNGVCLTAVGITKESFAADVSPETMRRSSLGSLRLHAPLNLELALTPSTRMGGHLVQGHVDATATLLSLDLLGDNNWWLRFRIPEELDRYVVFKGSIAVEGISLTVARVEDLAVSVTIIPHTYQNTNLPSKQPGDPLNIEADVLAKYVEKLVAPRRPGITAEKLIEEGY